MNTTWLAPSAALVLIALVSLLPRNTPAADSSELPPRFTLSIPASFNKSVTVQHHRKGEDLLNSPPFHLITVAPMTAYHGGYGPPTADTADPRYKHSWALSVYAVHNPKVPAAYAKARDGFEANLDEGQEFLGDGAGYQTFARFARKHFRWGNAVSFLHSTYQDGPDGGAMYVPDNNHLSYEVWGVTRDRQYTVVASVYVSHPRLTKWGPEVRIVKSIEAFKQDRDVKAIEACNPKQFEPNLATFDRLVDSLKMQ